MKADAHRCIPSTPGICSENNEKNGRGGHFLELVQDNARPALLSESTDDSAASDIHRVDIDSDEFGLRPCVNYDELVPKTAACSDKEVGQLQAQQIFPTSQYNKESLQSYLKTPNQGLTSLGHIEVKRPPSNQLLQQIGIPFEESESVVETPRRKPTVGLDFQAELPHHISTVGTAFQSIEDDPDSYRWQGTHIWPPRQHKRAMYKARVGKGRSEVCSCTHRGSIDCVRLHIEEKRQALKDEVGEAFFAWGFDKMGESVSEKWMHDEELTFQEIVRMNPSSLEKNFWISLLGAFPSKSMADLVSYYFNVFVVRKRAMQNRYNPENIDSDDDETEFFESEGDEISSMLDAGDEVGDSGVEDNASEDETGEVVSHISEVSGDEECNQACDPAGWDTSSNNKMSDGLMEGLVVHPPSLLAMTMDYENIGSLETKENDWDCTQSDRIRAGETQEILDWDHTSCHLSGQEEKRTGMMHTPLFCNDRQVAEDCSACKDSLLVSSHHPALDQCEPKVWEYTMELSSQEDADKLISTNGMMREFFGDEDWMSRE